MTVEVNIIFPNYMYAERVNGLESYIQPQWANAALVGGTTNSLLVAATAGKVIRVTSIVADASTNNATYVSFKSGNASANRLIIDLPANTLQPRNPLERNDTGWVETDPGVGLYVDVGAGGGAYISIRYLLLSAFIP